jgi:ABC-2 type transport system ATP-binding protein
VVELVGLEDALDRLVGTYSGGMKRRLELARGLMTDPEVLFLDEPTLGLDVQNRVVIWEYIRRLRKERGLTVVLTTNYMEEAEALADVVGIIDQGRLVVEGSPQKLVAGLGADVIRLQVEGSPQTAAAALEGQPFVQTVSAGGDCIVVGVGSSSQALAPVIERLVGRGINIGEVSIARPTLSDVFIKHTGRRLRDQ